MSGGSVVIRDQANQQQDVEQLSRDTDNANGSIGPIFDKEKDHYAPKSSSVRNIWTEVKGKIDEGQTTNVVINISDTKMSMKALQNQFTQWPVLGMDKLIVIDKSGNAIRIK